MVLNPSRPVRRVPASAASAVPHHHDHPWRPLLVRFHFFAGVIAGPLVVIAAVTGILYVFAPSIERAVYHNELVAEANGRPQLPVQQQVEAAIKATPNRPFSSVKAAVEPDETTRVNFSDPSLPAMSSYSVYVDPYTGDVRGNLVTRHGGTPVTAWLSALHGDLHLGTPGRVYAELASHWLAVLTLGGLILWWERSARHVGWRSRRFWRRFALVDRNRPGLHTTLSWHSVIGMWTALIALVIALTGLMVGVSSGPTWNSFLASQSASTPRLNTTLPGGTARATANDPMAGHDHGSAAAPTDVAPGVPRAGQLPDGASIGTLLASADKAGVNHTVTLTAPTKAGQGWTASEGDLALPVHADQALLDPTSGDVVRTMTWDSWPTLAKANRLLLFFHFGRTLGLANDVILVVGMVGLLAITWWGYRMWWARRPSKLGAGFGRPPRRGAWRSAPRGRLFATLAVLAVWGWIVPVFGLSLVAFLVVDSLIGYAKGHHRQPPTPDVEMVAAHADEPANTAR